MSREELSAPIRELILRLDKDQDKSSPQLWVSISQLVEYKREKYKRILFDESTKKGLIKDLENAQDKYVSSLCNFGQTKDDIIFILSQDPMNIHSISLPKSTPLTEQTITDLENNIGLALRVINKENALDGTKMALAAALGINLQFPKNFNKSATDIWNDKKERKLDFSGEQAQMLWLGMSRDQKMKVIKDILYTDLIEANDKIPRNPYQEFIRAGTNFTQLEKLQEYYSIKQASMTKTDNELEKYEQALRLDGKWDKLNKYSKPQTQCDGQPAFFGEQSSSDVWQYLRSENAEYFSLLSRYNTIKDILNKIETIANEIADKQRQLEYYQRLRQSIINFDISVKGVARLDLKEWLRDEVFAFLDLWRVFRRKYLNMALLGPPGSGKTTIAEELGPIFSNLGVLILGRYSVVSRSDLVGQYVGETANKVRSILDSMLESVLFIDEAYAVACSSPVLPGFENEIKFDQFGIEGINEIVNYLDKNKGSIMVIAAGYERDMKYCFFGANVGLARRFPTQYILKDMPSDDLHKIFTSALKSTIGDQNLSNILTQNAQNCMSNLLAHTSGYWTNQAGDMVNLAEIVASKRAAKGRPLAASELHNILAELFSQKDLTHIRNIPESVQNQMIRNWDQLRVANFFDNLDFLRGDDFASERNMLKGIFRTGQKLSEITPEKTTFLQPEIQFGLLDAVETEKDNSQKQVQDYFKQKNKEYCGTDRQGDVDDTSLLRESSEELVRKPSFIDKPSSAADVFGNLFNNDNAQEPIPLGKQNVKSNPRRRRR